MVTTVERPSEKKTVLRETILSPRFYTTDFEAAARFDLSLQEVELKAVLEEMRHDYNRDHFTRDGEFENYLPRLSERERAAFVDYLERSCISEFSGFLLFKELSRQLKGRHPLLAEIFHLMARDEARHAGFLNKAMADFQISLDLGKITKTRTYTFFPLEWILYTVYLSEKIGYWRYILIYRHLEEHPDHKFNPLFNYFESWCQDENRHGDIFKALIRARPELWNNGKARLWGRFFLLSVFATHSLTVRERADFYDALGLDARAFDAEVIRRTNETSARAFPTILDVEHPEFFPRLERCGDRHSRMKAIDGSAAPKWLKKLRKLPLLAGIFGDLLRLYLIAPIDAEAVRCTVR